MSEFLEWLTLMGPWGFVLAAWALLASVGVLLIIWHELAARFLRTDAGHHVARWLCRRFDHEWLADERGRPVTAFNVCLRCGKIGDRLP